MADSFIQLSPDSTGKKVDTRTAPDGDHREVQVIGSPTTADVAEADATNGLDVDVTRLPALPAGTNNIGDVDVLTVPAPLSTAGGGTEATALRVTLASDSTGLVSVDDNGGSLTVDGTVTINPIPAGTNNIGDVDITSLPNEGQQTMAGSISVAIASDQSTVPVSLAAGGTTQYAEDTPHVSGDQVTMAGVVQQTADAALSTDGDRSLLQVDASGFLKVNIKAGAGSGGTAQADESAFTEGATSFTPVGGVLNDTITSDPTEDQAAAVRITAKRAIHVNLRDVSGNEVTPGGGTQYDEDTVSAAADKITMAGVVRKDTAATLVDTDGDRTQLQVDAVGRLHVNGSGVTQPVSAASLPLPTGAATLAGQTQPGVDIGDVTVNNAAGASAVNIQDGGNVITVDGTVGVSGAVDTELPAAVALADNTVNPTVPAVGSFLMAFDGTNWDRVQTGAAATGSLKVDGSAVTQPVSAASLPLPTGAATSANQLAAGHDVTAKGAAADGAAPVGNPVLIAGQDGTNVQSLKTDTAGELQVDVLTLPALVAGTANIGDVDVLTLPALVAGTANIGDVDIASVAAGTQIEATGDVASDIPLVANPVTIGGRASTVLPTAVSADGDAVNLWANRNGALIMAMAPHIGLNGDPFTLLNEVAQYTSAQTSTVLVTGGAGDRIIVTKVQIQSYGTTAGTAILYFGTGAYVIGTDEAIFDGEFAPSVTLKPGVVMDGPFRAGALGDDLLVTTTNAQSIRFNVWYYIATV